MFKNEGELIKIMLTKRSWGWIGHRPKERTQYYYATKWTH